MIGALSTSFAIKTYINVNLDETRTNKCDVTTWQLHDRVNGLLNVIKHGTLSTISIELR